MALDSSSTRRYKVDSLLLRFPGNDEKPIGYEAGAEGFTNESIRKKLAAEWISLDKEEQTRLRAMRHKRGIKCDHCGLTGYYRENCPNGCAARPISPDSMDSTPEASPEPTPRADIGLGVMWGDLGFGDIKDETSILSLPFRSKKEAKRLRKTDQKVESFNFLHDGEEGYNRDMAELTLHQILRRLVRVLEKALKQNWMKLESRFDSTLLHPPSKQLGRNFYPDTLGGIKMYRDFYNKKSEKLDRLQKAYMYKGHLRSEDALDAVLRGGDVGNSAKLYKPDPEAMQSVHSKLGWKQPMSKYDTLANSDPQMIHKAEEVKALFAAQGAWAQNQQKDMEFRNDRFEHLLNILRTEIHKEHERENTILHAEKRAMHKLNAGLWIDRFESVDRITMTIKEYGMSSGMDDLDLIMFTLDKWKNEQLQARARRQYDKQNAKNARALKIQQDLRTKKGLPGSLIGLHDFEYYDAEKYEGAHDDAQSSLVDDQSDVASMSDSNSVAGSSIDDIQPAATATGSSVIAATQENDDDDDDDNSPNVHGSGPSPYIQDLAYLKKIERERKQQRHLKLHQTASLSVNDNLLKGSDPRLENSSMTDNPKTELKTKNKNKIERWMRKDVHKVHVTQKEKDDTDMAKVKLTFQQSDFARNLRHGNNLDMAHLMPALIPIPTTFVDSDREKPSSKVADEIIWKARARLIDPLSGYSKQSLLPLYVRNTLIEHNGTSVGGDLPQEIMQRDKRYSHTMGRSIAHFDPDGFTPDSFLQSREVNSLFYSPYRRTPPKKLKPIRSIRENKTNSKDGMTKAERKKEREKAKAYGGQMMTAALLRLSFTAHRESEMDYLFQGGMRG